MNSDAKEYFWRRMKKKDIALTEKLLSGIEYEYVSACGRFLNRDESKDSVWLLTKKSGGVSSLIVNSRSTVIPVLRGVKILPDLRFFKGFLRSKKIHSIQGIKNEVLILEEAVKKFGLYPEDTYDYDLMSLEGKQKAGNAEQRIEKKEKINIGGRLFDIILRTPGLSDLDAVAPLRAAYEKEEVIPKGSDFYPAASRVNIAKIIAGGRILVSEIEGRIVGKINVSSVSFTRFMVGGVYVHPDFRGCGIASLMASVFINALLSEGKGISLFVKKTNTAARRLYLRLGFKIQNDYRISYY